MSCSMTIDAVKDQTKTVTRRHVDTWQNLKAGDRLTLIEKGMGLPKGTKHVVLAEVVIVDSYVEPLGDVTELECMYEGFPHLTPPEFCVMWAASHGYPKRLHPATLSDIECRRIEWKYL